jgi:hypothetical protein
VRVFTAFMSLTILTGMGSGLQAASYFVTQAGAGSKNGTSAANAWSVANYNTTGAPTGGDTVFFSGTITSTVTPPTGGTGNGANRLTLDFTGALLNAAIPRIKVNGKNYINFLGGSFGSGPGVTLVSTNGSIFHDDTFSGWTYLGNSDGSSCDFLSGQYPQFVEISNNHLENCTLGYSDSTNTHDILIKNNYIQGAVNTTEQIDIISFGDAYNVTIEGNKIIQRAPGATSGRHNDGIQTFQSGTSLNGAPYGWVIRYNWIELDVPSGSGDNSWLMLENLADGPGGIPAMKIYSNVFVGDVTSNAGNNGVVNDGSGFTTYFYNNTVIRHNAPDNTLRFLNFSGPGMLYAKNNVGQSNPGTCCSFLSWTVTIGAAASNYFFNFSGCSSNTSGAGGSCSTDPKFIDYTNGNFALQASSPLIGRGDSSIGSEYSQGIGPGSTWPQPALVARTAGSWDVGAFQTATVSVPPPGPVTTLTQ